MRWVRLSKYCELSGETRSTVDKKRLGETPLWAEGKQWKVAPDRVIWINTEAVDEWIDKAA